MGDLFGPPNSDEPTGPPWTSDGFRTSWGKLCARAGIIGLTFHNLRGSAATRFATAGASMPEIAEVTGHSLMDVACILDRHYLGKRTALAEAAIRKLEKSERRTKPSNRFSNRSKSNCQDKG